ncbi:hypothetical protein [Clostridium sporogenes]|uniref:hypothetical protein n=1 Tax=Clostridium sporogenes TaxID=1509 RepID=UPI0013D6BAB8|nr:hypothetical protein [Clostridium sporogenes]
MRYCMEFGDTNFIGVVNAMEYKSFVHEDWELGMLLQHFYDVDKDECTGTDEKDILLNFTKVSEFQQTVDKVLWCNF